ncbi:hypothetical protein C6502_07370 [Candidatus Poribacteria bacterium]|nr:MAG: hypothetical protein C6502_07370 [Candidatus Poribacteria bacterium]
MAVIPNGGIIGVVASNLIHLGGLHMVAPHTTLTYDSPIIGIAFSPNNPLLASGSVDNTIQLWDPVTETLKATLHGHTSDVLSVAFSPDGSLLASGSVDNTVRLWDPVTETLKATLHGHTYSVLSVAFSPNGSLLASGGTDGTVRLWNPDTETLEATLEAHIAKVLSVAFSPNGSLLASASADGLVGLWDTHTEMLQATLGHESPVLSVAFSPDGNLLATGSADGRARLWDPYTRQLKATLGHESPVASVAFDGNILISGSADGTIRQWEITSETAPTSSSQRSEFESTTPAGYTRVTLNDRGTVWGVPTRYTTDSNVGTVAYMLLGQLKGCSFSTVETSRESIVYVKTQSLGRLDDFASETVCGKSSRRWTSSWNGVRITHLRFFDESNTPNIREAIYNTVTGQIELPRDGELSPETSDPVVSGESQTEGITASTAGDKMYWTDGVGKIQRANLDGTNVQDLVTTERNGPGGIALDVTDGKMYWADDGVGRGRGKIQRANLDGTNVQDLVTTGLVRPQRIALDVAGGKMYWTNWGEDRGRDKIQRANLDGTNVQDLVTTGLGIPNGIALDVTDGKMYWTDGGTDKIQRANLDGTNVQDLVTTGLENPYGIALDVMEGKMYWTDGGTDKIQRANLDGTNVQDLVTTGLVRPEGIALHSYGRFTTHTFIALSLGSPATGKQLILPLNITNGENVAGYQATIQFDTTALRYVSSENGDYLPDAAFFAQTGPEENLVTLSAVSLAGESSGDGTLATLTFEVVELKASTIKLSKVRLSNSEGKLFVPQVESTQQITVTVELEADVNGDGTVDFQDLVVVQDRLGQTGPNSADVNGDGIVDIADLTLVAGAIGNGAAAPSLHPQFLGDFTMAEVKLWLSQAQRLDLTDPRVQKGILFLEQLLAALLPKETVLLPNYPNPFNPETWIPYRLAEDAFVTLTIYDTAGRVVRTLDVGHRVAAIYESRSKAIHWDGRNEFGEGVASGVYFYHLSAGNYSAMRKMVILK